MLVFERKETALIRCEARILIIGKRKKRMIYTKVERNKDLTKKNSRIVFVHARGQT